MSFRSSKSFKEYDVFLNFRGIDTRSGFTSFLHDALVRENYTTFIDNEELERGEAIDRGLVEAIENSSCSITILSENYASSTSCLRELAKIVECMKNYGQKVLPVFYYVEPSHVGKLRIQTYKKEFAKYDKNPKYDFEEVQSWKDALQTVSGLAGWTIEETDNQANKIKDIIADISMKLHGQDESFFSFGHYGQDESLNEPRRQSKLPDVADLDRSFDSKLTVGNSYSRSATLPLVNFKDPSYPNICCGNVLPGSKIPTYFTKISPSPIIAIQKNPNWTKRSDWIGLALCVSLRANSSDSFSCEMDFGNDIWEATISFPDEIVKRSDYIWLFYFARDDLPAEWLQSSYDTLNVSFHVNKTSHHDSYCGPCGYSSMYREDIETWNQIASNNYKSPKQNYVDSSRFKRNCNYLSQSSHMPHDKSPPILEPTTMWGRSGDNYLNSFHDKQEEGTSNRITRKSYNGSLVQKGVHPSSSMTASSKGRNFSYSQILPWGKVEYSFSVGEGDDPDDCSYEVSSSFSSGP